MQWSKVEHETLTRLWGEGHSPSKIAQIMGHGLTRNAIMGKSWRLGLRKPKDVEWEAPTPKPKKQPAPKIKTRVHVVAMQQPRKVKTLPEIVVDPKEVPEYQKKQLTELGSKCCKWPVGDPRMSNFFFCGRDRQPNFVYCPYHCRMAYRPRLEKGKTQGDSGWLTSRKSRA